MAVPASRDQSPTGLQEEQSRPKKRRAIASSTHQACTLCKARKVRCDAARPRCSYCVTHDKTCEFPPLYRRARCSQAYVAEMEAKIRQYESRLESPALLARQENDSPSTFNPNHARSVPEDAALQATRPQHLSRGENAPRSHESRRVVQPLMAHQPGNTSHLHSGPVPWGDHPAAAVEASNGASQSRGPQPLEMNNIGLADLCNDQEHGPARTESSGSPSLEEDGSDGEQDDVDNPIMDGMVEYMGSSPDDVPVEGSFGASSTFNFALKIRASTAREGELATGRPGELPASEGASSKLTSIPATHVGSNGHGKSSSTRMNPEPQAEQENLQALKSYINQSYLQFLPVRMVATALLDRYFVAVHPVWPFLNEEATRNRFELTWSADESPSPMWMAQLNLIFALACQFYETEAGAPVPDVYDAGRNCYIRGQGFVIAHAFSKCSISMVQTLLLVAQYQQGTMRSNECWLTTGHATRMALGLSLHTSPSDSSGLKPLDVELRKRLWWGCFSLDRVCSMIYGRPIGIPHVRATTMPDSLPQPVDDRHIAAGEGQPDGVPSVNAFFVNSVNLYRVMDEILERLHEALATVRSDTACHVHSDRQNRTARCTCNAVPQLAAILQLDGLLLDWHESLPTYLKFSLDSVKCAVEDDHPVQIQRQRVILKIRFLGLRILLHRQTVLFLLQPRETRRWPRNSSQKWPPLFSDDAGESFRHHCDSPGRAASQSSLETQLAHLSASLCVASAQLQIESVAHYRSLNLTGAWWWDFHFIFNSLCVLFGAMGLRKDDLSSVLPDVAKAKSVVHQGFGNIHNMASRGGGKVAQSERFLKRLMKATLRRGQKSAHPIAGNSSSRSVGDDRTQAPIHASTNYAAQPLSENVTPSAMQDFMDLLPDASANVDGIDWLSNLNNVFSTSTGNDDGNIQGIGTPTFNGPYAMENLLQTSFESWTALEGTMTEPVDMENLWW